MNNGEFTQTLNEKLQNLPQSDTENFSTALEYLKQANNFRTFSNGLTHFITEHGYNGDPMDTVSKTTFLVNKFTDLNYKISRQTILNWFNDSSRPDPVESSRDKLFALCFALKCSLEKVSWFFRNVYFDRSFNCRSKKEAVYYYCIKNKLSYTHAQNLLHKITSLPLAETMIEKDILYTKDLTKKINYITTDDDLIQYIQSNATNFCENNVSALENITKLLKKIQGKPTDKAIVNTIEKSNNKGKLHLCGLVVQDYIKYNLILKDPGEKNPNFASIEFMLNVIFSEKANKENLLFLSKSSTFPNIIRMNFPTKKTLSDIITKKVKSYDVIRKTLILLKFYEFWFLYNNDDSNLFETYVDETNDLLINSGFDYLYIGNPYDWLFFYSAKTANPLDSFREIVTSTLDDELDEVEGLQ